MNIFLDVQNLFSEPLKDSMLLTIHVQTEVISCVEELQMRKVEYRKPGSPFK